MADQQKEIVIKVSAKNLTKKEFDDVRRSVSGVTSDIERQRGTISGMAGSLKSMAGLMGVTFGVGAVTAFVGSVFNAAEQVADLAGRMGVGAEEAQRFAFAARQSGGDIEDVSKSIVKMNQVLSQGDKGTVGLLKGMGLSLDDLRAKKPEEAFRLIAGAIEKIPNPIQQTDIALQLLGKSGAALLPALRNGFLQAADGASVMSEETVKALDDAKQEWENFTNDVTIATGNLLGTLQRATIGSGLEGFKKLFGDIRATAGGLLEGGFAGAGAAHDQYVAGLRRVAADQRATKEEADQLKAANQRLAGSNQWLTTTTGELTEAQKKNKAAAEAQRKAIEGLVDEMSGAKLRAEVQLLNAAMAKLNDEQKKNPEVLERMLAKIKPLVAAGGLPTLSKEAHDLYIKHLAMADILPKVGGGFDTLLPKARGFTMEVKEQTRSLQEELAILQQVRDFQGFINKGPLDLSSAFAATGIQPSAAPSLLSTFFGGLQNSVADFGKQLAPTLLQSLMGGGNQTAAVNALIGQRFGAQLTTSFGGFLTKNLGKTFGGAASSALSGLAGMASPFIDKGIDKLLGDGILGTTASWASKGMMIAGPWGAAAGAIGGAIAGAFKRAGNDTKKAREEFSKAIGFEDLGKLYGDLRKLGAEGEKLAHIGVGIIGKKDDAANRKWMEDVKKFYDDIKVRQQDELDTRDRLQATVEKYGFTIEELGPKWRAQKMTEQARGLLEEMALLTGSGIEYDTVVRRMGDTYNEFFQTAMRTNSEVPESMRPMLQRMVDLGLLVDADGKKIEDLEGTGVTFSQTMSQGFKGVIDKLDELITKITGDLGKALTTVPPVKIEVDDSAVDEAINRPRGWKGRLFDSGDFEMRGAQHGGLFSRPAVRVIAEAGPEIVGSPDAIVNALAEAMSRAGLAGGGVSLTFNLHTPIGAVDTIRQAVYEEIMPRVLDALRNNVRGSRTDAQQILGVPVH